MNHDMSYVVTDRVLLVPEIRFRFFRNQPKKVVFGYFISPFYYEKVDKNSAKFLVLTSLQKTHFSMALRKTQISGMSARSGFFTSQVCFEDEWANQSKVDKTQ